MSVSYVYSPFRHLRLQDERSCSSENSALNSKGSQRRAEFVRQTKGSRVHAVGLSVPVNLLFGFFSIGALWSPCLESVVRYMNSAIFAWTPASAASTGSTELRPAPFRKKHFLPF